MWKESLNATQKVPVKERKFHVLKIAVYIAAVIQAVGEAFLLAVKGNHVLLFAVEDPVVKEHNGMENGQLNAVVRVLVNFNYQ